MQLPSSLARIGRQVKESLFGAVPRNWLIGGVRLWFVVTVAWLICSGPSALSARTEWRNYSDRVSSLAQSAREGVRAAQAITDPEERAEAEQFARWNPDNLNYWRQGQLYAQYRDARRRAFLPPTLALLLSLAACWVYTGFRRVAATAED